MKRIIGLSAVFALSLIILASCSTAPTPSSSTASSSATNSSATLASSSEVVLPATSSDVASSDAASSDAVSSDAVSSDAASSDVVSSDRASSNAASSEPVLSGPSGIAEMNVPMQYISVTDVLAIAQGNDNSKVIIDLRKPADTKTATIQGAIFAPMNKAVDNNNYADAIANLTSALVEATGDEVGEGKDLILVCYQGKKYAQAATDILNALGADMDHVYTMEGGFKAWNEAGNPTVAG